jgi:hypothetical protein
VATTGRIRSGVKTMGPPRFELSDQNVNLSLNVETVG